MTTPKKKPVVKAKKKKRKVVIKETAKVRKKGAKGLIDSVCGYKWKFTNKEQ